MSGSAGRFVDHVVMPVAGLASARALFEGLGFTVAPDAAHPFGTGNACVFLADGIYIEPLAVLDRDLAESEAVQGNAFLRRDVAYRLRHALPGFSGVALRSDDAEADNQAFRAASFEAGDILEFGRRFETPDGEARDLRFRLAFAGERHAPETFVFSCQRLFDAAPDRGALTAHANGVSGLQRLVYSAMEPEATRPFLETVLGSSAVVANSYGFSLTIGNAVVEVLGPDGLAARYGEARGDAAGLRFVGLVLETADMERVRPLAAAAGLQAVDILGRLVVHMPEPSAAFLAFETAVR
ncbi:VOC family protein [Aureimonas leprariae]|uniref:VOC family protein n=1 Tax=Plantimonas leprariae TaxID=2615207 RepID=A0A7V7TXI3_9HYPH|nr:VOC family protein [Aureimonas leprariae]KAB0681774.1 VOC family protein [Aureimonas leprariae]